MEIPKISLVIPNLNCAEFLEQTIVSVIEQSYPNLELILSDGGSTDGSLDIAERYRDAFAHIISEPDTGQANAVNKGFALATGDIMGWINSDDVLMPDGLATVGSIFGQHDSVNWLTGRITTIDEAGDILHSHRARCVSYPRFLAGDYQWVQQESTYWRRSLWDKAGGQLDESLKLAVDGELWMRFLRFSELVPVDARIGAFRFRKGQRSEAMDAYHAELLNVIERERLKPVQDNSLTRSVLGTSLALRSKKEADKEFPGLPKADPAKISRWRLWALKVASGWRSF